MEPTLNINDRVLVIKDKFLNLNYKIGDVIVFYNPDYVYQKSTFEEFYDSLQIWNFNNQQLTIDTAFIKRVVGFEGDEIKIKDGDIYNNGTLIKFANIPVNETKVDVTYIVPSNSIFVLFTGTLGNSINVPLLYISPSLILISSPSKPTTLFIKAVSIVNCWLLKFHTCNES